MTVVGCAQPPPPRPSCQSPPPPQVLADSWGGGVASGPVVVAPLGLRHPVSVTEYDCVPTKKCLEMQEIGHHWAVVLQRRAVELTFQCDPCVSVLPLPAVVPVCRHIDFRSVSPTVARAGV